MGKKKDVITKIDLGKTNKEIERAIGDITRDAYIFYGGYVNNFRAITNVNDGNKISYRRLIYAAMQYPKGKLIPSLTLISSISQWHPHGTANLNGVNAALVNSGIFSGRGFFGSTSMSLDGGVVSEPSNERYLQSRLSDLYWKLLEDPIKEVPMVESPQGAMEPAYIPLPFPMCLSMVSPIQGLGVATRAIYPIFTERSLYEAYKANNPKLLKSKIDLLIDYDNSELERLWKTGKGKVIYSYKISRTTSPDGKTEGILFEGDTSMFAPNFKKFKQLSLEGKVYGEDVSDINGEKYFIGRVPGARGITIEDIEGIARKCCYDDTTYNLMVTDQNTCFRIPMYDRLDYTYKNYINLITRVNQRKIEKTTFDIAVYESLPIISDYILNKNPMATDEEISKALNLHPDVVSAVMSKPISYIRKNKDSTERLSELKKRLKSYKSFDPEKYVEEVINQFG